MDAITFALTTVAGLVMALGICGMRGSLTAPATRAGWLFSLAFVLLAVKFTLRGLVWDFALPLFEWTGRDDLVALMRDYRAYINAVFAVLVIIGGVMLHLSFYWSLPDDDRPRWRRWTAWLHPRGGRPRP